MLKKIILLLVLTVFSSSVFSFNNINTVIESLENKTEKKYINELTQKDLTIIPSIKQLASIYIDLADEIQKIDCYQLQKLYKLLLNDEINNIKTIINEQSYLNDIENIECQAPSENTIQYITHKLHEKAITLYTMAIINGDLDSISELVKQGKAERIPTSHFRNLITYLEKHSLDTNHYAMFLMGQLYLNNLVYTDSRLEKARKLFEQIMDIDSQEVLYFIALAKIEETIEKLYFSIDENNHLTPSEQRSDSADDDNIIELIVKMANLNDVPTLLYLSYYYSDTAINQSLTYFNKACIITSSEACNIYADHLKQKPTQQEIYTLLQKFDKKNPDFNTAVAIGKWYENEHKYINAINYYSYATNKDPKLLLKMAELYSKIYRYGYTYIENDIMNYNRINLCYIKYLSYFDDVDIKYAIYLNYQKISQLRYDPEDEQNALFWLEASATDGHKERQYEIAEHYKWGRFSEKNYSKAAYWYNRYCTDNPIKETPDYCQAFTKINSIPHLQENADNGDMEAQYQMGTNLIKYTQLYKIGENYLKKAEDQGHFDAGIELMIYRPLINFSG